MSTKARFIALLTVVVILMSFLMNSHSFSAPHRRSTQPADLVIVIVIAGTLVSLVLLIVLALYFRDIPGAKKKFGKDEGHTWRHLMASVVLVITLSIFFKFFSSGNGTAASRGLVNGTILCTSSSGLLNLTNCTPPSSGPLLTARGNSSPSFSSTPVSTHLWMVFLLPVLFSLAYAGYYYYNLGREELKRKKKIERAIEFDRKLDGLGLEGFSNPKEAIVEIYKNAVLWLEGLGIPYRESWTHWEHAEHVRYMHDAFVELTRLFEKAKYASERLSWNDAEKALEVYNKLRGRAREIVGGS
jgi:hypothetical protein